MFERQGLGERAEAERKQALAVYEQELRGGIKRHESVRDVFRVHQPCAASALALYAFDEKDWKEVVRILEGEERRDLPVCRVAAGSGHQVLGEAYLRLGRIVEGMREIESAFADDPDMNNARAHFAVAELFIETGVPIRARIHYKKAYEMDPENVTYRMEYERSASTERSHK
jgi:tetratricopeptide (TPR) repeat protein